MSDVERRKQNVGCSVSFQSGAGVFFFSPYFLTLFFFFFFSLVAVNALVASSNFNIRPDNICLTNSN